MKSQRAHFPLSGEMRSHPEAVGNQRERQRQRQKQASPPCGLPGVAGSAEATLLETG